MKQSNTLQHQSVFKNEALPFRAAPQSIIVGAATLKSDDFSGLKSNHVKISEYGLEQYLNACTPTCHG